MEEIWRPIKGYEGLYEVSNLGRIKSLNYGGIGKEQILKLDKRKNGYLQVMLYKDKKGKQVLIHRLVAQAFIENPCDKPCVNHIDCDKQNNCVDNLEWVTHKENSQYASKLERLKSVENGKKNSKSIIAINLTTGEEIPFESIREAGRQLNLKRPSISKVLKGKLKRTGNFTFKYKNEEQENALF